MWRDEYSALSMSHLGRMKCDARKGSCVCMYTYVRMYDVCIYSPLSQERWRLWDAVMPAL